VRPLPVSSGAGHGATARCIPAPPKQTGTAATTTQVGAELIQLPGPCPYQGSQIPVRFTPRNSRASAWTIVDHDIATRLINPRSKKPTGGIARGCCVGDRRRSSSIPASSTTVGKARRVPPRRARRPCSLPAFANAKRKKQKKKGKKKKPKESWSDYLCPVILTSPAHNPDGGR